MASDGAASVDFFGGSFTLAASALCCYEYVITLDEEMRCIWRRRISAASVLFVLNRYAILAASFASLFQVLPWGQQSESGHYQGKTYCFLGLFFAAGCLLMNCLSAALTWFFSWTLV